MVAEKIFAKGALNIDCTMFSGEKWKQFQRQTIKSHYMLVKDVIANSWWDSIGYAWHWIHHFPMKLCIQVWVILWQRFLLWTLTLICSSLHVLDEYNNNDSIPSDILKLIRASGAAGGITDDSASLASKKSLVRQDTSDTSVVDYNIYNDEMRLRNNLENMYKKGNMIPHRTNLNDLIGGLFSRSHHLFRRRDLRPRVGLHKSISAPQGLYWAVSQQAKLPSR